jgi:hypothetical protein
VVETFGDGLIEEEDSLLASISCIAIIIRFLAVFQAARIGKGILIHKLYPM